MRPHDVHVYLRAMRLAHSLPLLLVAACGDTGTTSASASATDSATGSTGAPDPTTGTPTTTGDTPTGGSGGATDSGTTTSPFTSTTATTSDTADTGDTGGSTMSLQTEPLPDTTTTAPDSTSTTPDETTSSETTTGTTGTTGDEACACPDLEVPLDDGIFVLSITAQLWKYFPETNMFDAARAELGCDLPPPTFSMAVDRLGFAWVSTRAARCARSPSPTSPTAPTPATRSASRASSTSAWPSCRTAPSTSATASTAAVQRLPEGTTSSTSTRTPCSSPRSARPRTAPPRSPAPATAGPSCSPSNPATLVEVDKDHRHGPLDHPAPGVNSAAAWAFAFFAGDFYFFTDGQNDFTSEVTHIDYDDSDNNGQQDIVQVFNNAPLRILGAGVSTCVPTLPQ
jgi:hypothetical protein